MPTNWSRCSPSAHDLLDTFLSAVREIRQMPDYEPDMLVRRTWIGQAEQWAAVRPNKPDFWRWALGVHKAKADCKREPMLVTGPMSLSYLWDEYKPVPRHHMCETCFQVGGHSDDCPEA